MSEETRSKEALQGVLEQVRDLTGQLSSAAASADRRWKITAVVFLIFCAAVAIYLGVIYGKFRPYLDADFLVHDYLAPKVKGDMPALQAQLTEALKNEAPRMLEAFDVPMDELQPKVQEFREQFAADLKEKRKEHMDALTPRLMELKESIPELTETLSEALTDQAPAIADALRDNTIKVLPNIRDRLLDMTKEKLEARKPELQEVVDNAVRQVLDEHADNIQKLDGAELARTLQPRFEQAAGPVLDEFSKGVELAIEKIKGNLSGLLAKQASGKLTPKEVLELRYIQLWKTYWSIRMKEGVGTDDVRPLEL